MVLFFIVNQVATHNNDVQLSDFVESEFLGEQVSQEIFLSIYLYTLMSLICIQEYL